MIPIMYDWRMLTFMRLKVIVLSCRQTLLFYEWISTTDFFVVLPFGRADKTDFPSQHRTQRLRDTARELNKFSPASSSYCVLCEGAPSLPLGMQQGLCYEIASSCNKGKRAGIPTRWQLRKVVPSESSTSSGIHLHAQKGRERGKPGEAQ